MSAIRNLAEASDSREPVIALQARGICKSFHRTQALLDVGIEVRAGQLHALLGANGSGKSTFVKILAGVEHADVGELTIGGKQVDPTKIRPAQSRQAGLRFVHQDPGVFPQLTVAENLALGRGYPRARGPGGRIRWAELRRRSLQDLEQAQLDISPDTMLGDLPASSRTLVAIARALQDIGGQVGKVLVLDEPTSALPVTEVAALLTAVRRLTAMNIAVLLVTHHLSEVIGNADQVSVLRDGRLVAEVDGRSLTHDKLVEYIVGFPIQEALPELSAPVDGDPLLKLRDLSAGRLTGVSFDVRPGEVIGIAGLLGSGRSTLLRTLFGEQAPVSGGITLGGQPVSFANAGDAMSSGVGFVPEDRGGEAAFLDMSVLDNLLLASTSEFFVNGRMARRRERREARTLIQRFGIKARSVLAPLSTLSGGNQQKVIIARWLRRQPRLLLLDEPTQGVDIGARADIYRMVRSAAGEGAAVLLVVSDFEELAQVCDRVLVFRNGRLVKDLPSSQVSVNRIADLAYAG